MTDGKYFMKLGALGDVNHFVSVLQSCYQDTIYDGTCGQFCTLWKIPPPCCWGCLSSTVRPALVYMQKQSLHAGPGLDCKDVHLSTGSVCLPSGSNVTEESLQLVYNIEENFGSIDFPHDCDLHDVLGDTGTKYVALSAALLPIFRWEARISAQQRAYTRSFQVPTA